jgi:hypothetical protein
VGWGPDLDCAERFEIPLTAGHIEQLHKRRDDLVATNVNLHDDLDQVEVDEQAAAIDVKITTNRHAAQRWSGCSPTTATRSRRRGTPAQRAAPSPSAPPICAP